MYYIKNKKKINQDHENTLMLQKNQIKMPSNISGVRLLKNKNKNY